MSDDARSSSEPLPARFKPQVRQPDLIAYEMDGAALDASGFARLVVPNDGLKGRWVSNLVNLEVFSATPVPESRTAALLLAGLFTLVSAGAERGTVRDRAGARA